MPKKGRTMSDKFKYKEFRNRCMKKDTDYSSKQKHQHHYSCSSTKRDVSDDDSRSYESSTVKDETQFKKFNEELKDSVDEDNDLLKEQHSQKDSGSLNKSRDLSDDDNYKNRSRKDRSHSRKRHQSSAHKDKRPSRKDVTSLNNTSESSDGGNYKRRSRKGRSHSKSHRRSSETSSKRDDQSSSKKDQPNLHKSNEESENSLDGNIDIPKKHCSRKDTTSSDVPRDLSDDDNCKDHSKSKKERSHSRKHHRSSEGKEMKPSQSDNSGNHDHKNDYKTFTYCTSKSYQSSRNNSSYSYNHRYFPKKDKFHSSKHKYSSKDDDSDKTHANLEPKSYEKWEKNPDLGKQYVVTEIQADLFSMGPQFALAHCVAEDMNMGAGIALTFRQLFKRVDTLLDQRVSQGGVAFLEIDGRYIYYLVTKRISTGKPTYGSMYKSLEKLKKLTLEHNVKNVAIPRLACGLDRLEWNRVSSMIEYLFEDSDIKFTVCNFQKAEEDMSFKRYFHRNRKCNIQSVQLPINCCSPNRIIIYLGTLDKDQDMQFINLTQQFPNIRADYLYRTVDIGDIISTIIGDYDHVVCGCIVRKSSRDPIIYKAFSFCLNRIQQCNSAFKNGEHFKHIAIQVYHDGADSLLMSKMVNLLSNTLQGVEIEIYR